MTQEQQVNEQGRCRLQRRNSMFLSSTVYLERRRRREFICSRVVLNASTASPMDQQCIHTLTECPLNNSELWGHLDINPVGHLRSC